MPSYDFHCSACNNTVEIVTTIAERDKPLELPCYNCGAEGTVTRIFAAPFIGDAVRQGVKKADSGWRETLSRIKQHHPRATFDPDNY